MPTRATIPCAVAVLLAGSVTAGAAEGYAHFGAAVYARAYEVREMGDLEKLRARFDLV